MPCPVRIVFTTFVAVVVAIYMFLDQWQAHEELAEQCGQHKDRDRPGAREG